MEAPKAMASNMRTGVLGSSIRDATAMPMGSNIKVVAVFDSHMERAAVTIRNPHTSRRGDPPTV